MMFHKPHVSFISDDNQLLSFILKYKLSFTNKFKVNGFSTVDEAIQDMNSKPDFIVFDKSYPKLDRTSYLLQQLRAISPNVFVIILVEHGNDSFFKESKINYNCKYLVKENDTSKMADKLIQTLNNSSKTKQYDRFFFYLSIFILCSSLVAVHTLINLLK